MRFRLCVFALLAALAAPAEAQEARYSLALRDVPLEQALERLVEMAQISLVYGGEVDGERVFCLQTAATAEAILRCIVESAGVDYYQLSSGTFVVIERAEQAPRYGSLAGMVVDGETGEPLPGASVFLADASAGTASNAAGMFTFSVLEPGPYRLTASFIGYEPVATDVWVPADGRTRERIALRPKPFAATPVIVDGMQRRAPSALAGRVSLEGAALETAALGSGGNVRAARSLLGIADRPLVADLNIQGGETGEHVTTLDGAPVFDPVALGRVLGAFSPLAVERLTVRKAGFGAAHGSYTAGVVEIEQTLAPDQAAVLQLDPYSANARVGAGGARGAVMVAGRTSLWSLYRPGALDGALRRWNDVDPVLSAILTPTGSDDEALAFAPHRHGSDVAFTDLHAAARLPLGPFRTLRASAYRGSNEVATELFAAGLGPRSTVPEQLTISRDRYRWTNTTARVRVEALLGSRVLGQVGVRAGHHTLAHGYQTLAASDIGYTPVVGTTETFETALRDALDAQPLPDDGNRFTEWVADARLDVSLTPRHLVEIGVEGAVVDHAFHLDNPYLLPLRSASTLGRLAAFTSSRLQVTRRVTAESGLRLTWVPDRGAVYAEPRLALRFDDEQARVPYGVRIAGGLYRQFVNQFDVTSVGPSALVPSVRFWLPVDASLAPPLALHVAAEGLATPADGWTVRAETYYKHLPHLLALDYGTLLDTSVQFDTEDAAQASFIGAARGYAWGGGVRVERETGRLRLGAGYDYSRSRRTFPSRFDGAMQPTPWNQPHRLQASADLRLTAGLVARGRARGLWGRTWGYRQAYYDFLMAHSDALVGLPEDDRLPALVEVDLGLGYTRRVGGSEVTLTLDVLNVLDRGNVLDYGLRRTGEDTYEDVPRRALGIQPVLTLRIGR